MDDTDVPPLEDMSEFLHHSEFKKVNNHKKQIPSIEENISQKNVNTEKCVVRDKSPTNMTVVSQKSPTNIHKNNGGLFGGFKKGFLSGSSSSNSCAKVSENNDKTSDSIPYIKKAETADDSKFKFDEVKRAMEESQNFLNKKDWVTDDLLEKVQKNDVLRTHLSDPTFVQAIGEFQKDPQAAMLKYQGNDQMQQFLKEFCGIMGDHFSSMSEKTDVSQSVPPCEISVHDPQKAADDKKMEAILADTEVREILMDQQIQILFEMLRNKPQLVEGFLQTASPDLKKKIQKLVDAGLLALEMK